MSEVAGARKWFAVFALVSLLTATAACSDDKSDNSGNTETNENGSLSDPIIIGYVLGATGWMRFYDGPALDAARLAVDDINSAGGVLGRPLQLLQYDMKTDPPLGVNGVLEMIDKGAAALIAPGDYDTAAPALTTAEENQIPIISGLGSDYKLGLFGPYSYSMGLASNVQGAAGAEWAFEEQGWDSAYVLTDVTIEITKTAGQFFLQRFDELGGEIVGADTFLNDDASIGAQITSLQNASSQPDFIYMSSFIPGSASAIKQIRDAGIDLPILCQISCGEGVEWVKGIPGLSNFFYTNMGFVYGEGDPNAKVWELAQRFEQAYGSPMELSLTLGGYASVEMLAYAIEEAGSTDSEAIKQALDGAQGVDTVLGPVSFTPEFHMMYDIAVRIGSIVDGEQTFVTTWTPNEVNLTGENLPEP